MVVLSQPGLHDYAQGSVVDIVAIADSGWRFDSWTGDVADPSSATTTVTVATDMVVTALFKQSKLIWWLIGGGSAAVLAAGVLVGLAIRRRARMAVIRDNVQGRE